MKRYLPLFVYAPLVVLLCWPATHAGSRPHRRGEDRVQQDGARRAGEDVRVPAGQSAQAFTEPPHAHRPQHGPHDRPPDESRNEQADPEGYLHRREGEVPGKGMGGDQAVLTGADAAARAAFSARILSRSSNAARQEPTPEPSKSLGSVKVRSPPSGAES